jgi:hypothetical protein
MAMRQVRSERVRALRARAQHLTDAAPATSLAHAAAVCGLQHTPAGSAALALAARVPNAEPADIARALTDERALAIVWSRRGLPTLVPSADLAVFTLGLRPEDEDSWRAVIQGFVGHLETVDMTATELVALVNDAILGALDGRELTKRELGAALVPAMPASLKKWFDAEMLSSFTAALTRAASLNGAFVLSPRTDGETAFVRTDQWLGAFPADTPEATDLARREAVRRYLRAYGPSSAKAYAEWTQTSEGQARRAFEAVADETIAVSVEGALGWLLAEDEAVLGDVPPPEGVRLLPPHDAYLSSPDRRVIVPDSARHKRLFRAAGNPGAVLANGEVAAAWYAEKRGSRLELKVETFRTLPAAVMRSVEMQAPRLAAFMGASVVRVVFR